MQVDQLAAGPALQRGLDRVELLGEFAARHADPQIAERRQGLRHRRQFVELVALNMKNAHRERRP
jgi:hypothetical protein